MRRLRKVTGQEAIRALQRLGFEKVRQRGSHVILKKETSEDAVGCVIPLHRELKIGILRQTKVTPEEFMDVL